MSTDDWSLFLSRCSERTADTATFLSPLPDYAILEVAGPDAARFLQGQLTCHLDSVTATQGTPGAQCSLKGRVLASFLLGQVAPERYWLRLRRDLLEATAQSLGKYIVFSKARLTQRPELIIVGVAGPDARQLLDPQLLEKAGSGMTGLNSTQPTDDGLVWQRDAQGERFEYWLPLTDAQALADQAQRLNVGFAAASRWALLDIEAGVADVGAATSDRFLPQMLNYDLLGAVRFDKGCYTGQEIVARAHYRGQVKRRLGRFAMASEPPPSRAAVADATGREVGEVVLSAATGVGAAELLAVVADAAEHPLRIGTLDLRALPLPYAISDASR